MRRKLNAYLKIVARGNASLVAVLTVLPAIVTPSIGWADQVSLNGFSFVPGDPVTIATDGSSATLGQSVDFDPIQLANDPFLGDPNLIVPGPQVVLSFEYDFIEAAGEDDEFGAFIISPDTGDSIGSAFEFFTQDSSSGNISFDLSPLDGIADLGLLFQISEGVSDTGIASTVTVSNVRLEVIPEPGTAVAMIATMFALGGLQSRRRRQPSIA